MSTQDQIDKLIQQRQIILAIKATRDLHSCDLAEAIRLHAERYAELRRLTPDAFTTSEKEYWVGFYS